MQNKRSPQVNGGDLLFFLTNGAWFTHALIRYDQKIILFSLLGNQVFSVDQVFGIK